MIARDNSVVVMPTFARPEMLAHALMHLAKAEDLPPVHIFLDSGAPEGRLDEVRWVRDTYLPQAALHQQASHMPVTSGTWNILKSMEFGYYYGAEYVFIVEEDVMMRHDFMARHEAVRTSGNYKATCGRRVPAFFKKYGDLYTNPGSCLTQKLLSVLVHHINDEYFANTGGYIRKTFGHEPYNSSLDDGLIRMVMLETGWKCGYPEEPICAHQGFHWYDEIDIYSNRGTIQEKIARFGRITASIKPGDRYAGDFEFFPNEDGDR